MFQLAPYCLGPKETLDEFSEDPDRLLLSSIAEKVLDIYPPFVSDQTWLKVMVAKLVTIVRASYDPVSTNQTQRLVGCIQRTLQDFPSITPRLRSHCWFSCHLKLAWICFFPLQIFDFLSPGQSFWKSCCSVLLTQSGNRWTMTCKCKLHFIFSYTFPSSYDEIISMESHLLRLNEEKICANQ